MAKKGARYRRWRDDVFGHPKTGGMSLTSYGLMKFAVSQNILGVLHKVRRGALGIRVDYLVVVDLEVPPEARG
jgi:hypothetical protein